MGFLADLRTRLVGWQRTPDARPLPGLYTYQRETASEKVRIHLRIDPDGQGLLLVNASRVYHLNPSAATMAYLAMEPFPDSEAVQFLIHKYQLKTNQAAVDYDSFKGQLKQLILPDGACPICDLDLETTMPFSARPTAPYRMDLALTYHCNNNCPHCYNARPRDYPELSTDEWKRIIDRLWKLRIPHIVFTGGEPTLRDDLPELIAHAEGNGQITGINTNGRRMRDPDYVARLVDAGLDHAQITLESHDPSIHDQMVHLKGAWQQTSAGLQNALKTRLFVMTNTTLLVHNAPYLADTLDYLAETGVPTFGLNALIYSGRGANVGTGLPESQLQPLLELAREKVAATGQRLIWYTPTEYCHFDPVQMSLGVKGCSAALYNMCIEPDGAVIPCQSYYQPLGNLLTDPWESIWEHDLAISLRERRYLPEKCNGCALITECGGGCPLSRQKTVG